jgi:hypothetical protein
MNQKLFLKISLTGRHYDNYFVCKEHCVGMIGFSMIHKCTAALRMLAYEAPADTQDDYMCMAKYRFCKAVVALFGDCTCDRPDHGTEYRKRFS